VRDHPILFNNRNIIERETRMKNLHLASDEDIYRMRGMNSSLLCGYPDSPGLLTIKKQLDKEYIERGLDKMTKPLSWDFPRRD